MKVGDLVALSSYGSKLDALYIYSNDFRSKIYKDKQPLVGIVLQTTIPESMRLRYYSDNEQMRYHIKWLKPNGPAGRNGKHGVKYFFRNDLKFISKGKRK